MVNTLPLSRLMYDTSLARIASCESVARRTDSFYLSRKDMTFKLSGNLQVAIMMRTVLIPNTAG